MFPSAHLAKEVKRNTTFQILETVKRKSDSSYIHLSLVNDIEVVSLITWNRSRRDRWPMNSLTEEKYNNFFM